MTAVSVQRTKSSSTRRGDSDERSLHVEDHPCPVRAVAPGGNHCLQTREVEGYPVTVCGYCGVDWATLDATVRAKIPKKVVPVPKTNSNGTPKEPKT